jgi:hypothetical protein
MCLIRGKQALKLIADKLTRRQARKARFWQMVTGK